jgi:hypothetical protein
MQFLKFKILILGNTGIPVTTEALKKALRLLALQTAYLMV